VILVTTEEQRAAMRANYRCNAETRRQYQRDYRKRNLERIREQDRRRGGSDVRGTTEKLKARRQAQRAYPEPQPCEVCDAPGERHHDDYDKPLDIRWLCRAHHGETHWRI
jgi:hypothetical protein